MRDKIKRRGDGEGAKELRYDGWTGSRVGRFPFFSAKWYRRVCVYENNERRRQWRIFTAYPGVLADDFSLILTHLGNLV